MRARGPTLLLGALALLAACGAEPRPVRGAPGAWGRVERAGAVRWLVLADGRRQPVPRALGRIVTTLPNLTELVAYLAGVERLVGVSPHCNFPPEVERLPRVSVLPVDVEGLRVLAPDLVLCDPVFHAVSLPLLERHHLPVLTLESRSLAHLATSVRVLADVLDTSEAQARADALIERLNAAVARAARAGRTPPASVLLVGQADPLHVLGPGSLLDDLLRACGCRNLAADLGRPSAPFSHEAVLLRRPDWILTTWQPLPQGLRERWANLPAVRHGRIAQASADDLLRAGPRTPEALERLAAVLAGELAPERLSEAP